MRRHRLRLRNVLLLVAVWTLGVGAAWAAAQSPSFQQYGVGGQVQPPPTTGQTTTTTTVAGTTTTETSTTPPPTDTGTTPGQTTETSGAPLGEETAVSQPLAAVEAVGDTLPFTGSQALVAFVVLGAALAAAGLGFRRLGRQRSE
jgi:cytoskeletal protein RodZ